MKKVFKTLFLIGGTAFAGYLGFRIHRVVRQFDRLEKGLVGHLSEICNETPTIKCTLQMRKAMKISIEIGLSIAALAKIGDINETVLDFIRENHPSLLKHKTKIKAIEKAADFDHESGYSAPDEG
ncbi:MAG: hypothetical protein Q8M98_05335 [Candidatus Cloacimonadaceae bacterium]|nr:hypothetical protein [Candidatus Cloacimonadaceae bacterium]MDP3114184.1 hypothetical protein [Candidatus Cloacimonadaceae bacterium]